MIEKAGMIALRLSKDGDKAASTVIRELLQQRAELLEALKGLVESYTNPESGEVDRKLSMLDAQKIIESANQ